MGFYPKKINSLEELKSEKQRLLAESKKTDIRHVLSFDEIIARKESEKEEKNDASSIVGNILNSGSVEETVIGLVTPVLQKAGVKIGSLGKDLGKKVIGAAAKEVLGGYLKWKAVELSCKGFAYFIRSRKKRKHQKS